MRSRGVVMEDQSRQLICLKLVLTQIQDTQDTGQDKIYKIQDTIHRIRYTRYRTPYTG